MVHGEDRYEAIVSSTRERDLPDFIRNRPTLEPHLWIYYRAFCELSTCRPIGMAAGPIPFTAIVDYARHYRMNDEEADILLGHVRAMDSAYMDHAAKKAEKSGV